MEMSTCIRCDREVSVHDDEHSHGMATPDGRFICKTCVTPEEEDLAAQDMMRLGDALKDAGLSGDDVDVERMDENQYEMRESLAGVFYEQDDR